MGWLLEKGINSINMQTVEDIGHEVVSPIKQKQMKYKRGLKWT